VTQDPICIFGGAFDPIHIGHLIVAEDVRQKMDLPGIRFVPCNVPPTKESADASAGDRLEMVKLAIEGNSCFEASDTEIKREGRSYTVDTLREVSSRFGRNRPIYLLMGVDQLNTMESWRHPEVIIQLCTILAMRRPGFTPRKIPKKFMQKINLIGVRQVDISSTEVRKRLYQGLSARYLVPGAVLEYICRNGLYRGKEIDTSPDPAG